ncbi:hypothetical protein CHARACLAT_015758 [Characodon lateralis]|uniref:Uncharacterized protein n=1 Tax=Characodon lateralis TaxID=208331 RepID=A0ABU7ETZ6_9TELE|nr:hypothetical protein [Characodon lateralis]
MSLHATPPAELSLCGEDLSPPTSHHPPPTEPCRAAGLGHSWFDEQPGRCHDLLSNSTLTAFKDACVEEAAVETETENWTSCTNGTQTTGSGLQT